MLKENYKTASTEEISEAINDKDDPWLKKISDSEQPKSPQVKEI